MECPKNKRNVDADACEDCVSERVCYEWCFDHIVFGFIGEPLFIHPMNKYNGNLGKILKPIIEPERKPRYHKEVITQELRWEIWERDTFTCQNCGSRRFLTIDHIYPESLGGGLEKENLQTLCKSCNSKKSTKQNYNNQEKMK